MATINNRAQFQNRPYNIEITFEIVGSHTECNNVVNVLNDSEIEYTFSTPHYDEINVPIMQGGRPNIRIAGKFNPGKVVVYSEKDALLLRLKFGVSIYETQRSITDIQW